LTGRDIVCLSTHYWDERWFRKQEFMSRLARSNRVLFVEPSFSMVRRPEGHLASLANNRFVWPRLEQRHDRLWLLKPPRALPKWTDPRIERLTYRWFGRVVGRAIRTLRFEDVVLWIYRPSFYYGLEAMPHRHLVFDLVDDLPAYGGDEKPHVTRSVRALVQASDLFVVTAATLLDRYGHAARSAVQVPNGYDAGRFAERTLPRPALDGIRRPVLGFVGTVFKFLDFDLLEAVARCHHDKSVVIVGPVETSAQAALDRLLKRPNVHYLGPRPQAEVPSYIGSFDVCLNVFRNGRVADSVIPLKVFEYLAAGRPVVSTRMRALEQEQIAPYISFADGAEGLCAAIDRCLAEVQEDAERRREAVTPYSWDRLFERLDEACGQALV